MAASPRPKVSRLTRAHDIILAAGSLVRPAAAGDLRYSHVEIGKKVLITPNPEVHTHMLAIRMFLILAFALVTIATSSAREDNKCYSSCRARCEARYACEGRHPGPNCFTNFNKCRTSCWRMCRH